MWAAVIIINEQKLILYYAILLADKENLSFIYPEEPKNSAGHAVITASSSVM